MNDIALRTFYYLLVPLALSGCGNSGATDFYSSDRSGTETGGSTQGGSGGQPGGAGGTPQGGSSGAQPGGSGGAPPGGAGGTDQAGSGAGGSIATGGSAGFGQGGAAGAGAGGTSAGTGGMTGGSSTGGTGTTTYSCGSLMCFEGRQYCVRTPPSTAGGPEQRMCLPFADSCATLDCACMCKPPQMSPCGPGSTCMCSGEGPRITVVCSNVN